MTIATTNYTTKILLSLTEALHSINPPLLTHVLSTHSPLILTNEIKNPCLPTTTATTTPATNQKLMQHLLQCYYFPLVLLPDTPDTTATSATTDTTATP